MLSWLVESVQKPVHTVDAMQLPNSQSSFGFLLLLMQARADVLLLLLLLLFFICSSVLVGFPCFFCIRLSVRAI
jgi:hypothetical protein